MTYRLNGEKGKSMNVTREEKMAEAIERMKALRVFKPTIKQFKDDGYISISEPPFGAFYWAEGDDLKRIREFEEQNNALVYLVVRSYTTFGKMDCSTCTSATTRRSGRRIAMTSRRCSRSPTCTTTICQTAPSSVASALRVRRRRVCAGHGERR